MNTTDESQVTPSLTDFLTEAMDQLDELYSEGNAKDATGIPTGFCDLDEKIAGLDPGDLIIVAGRPSMGKTSFCLNIAEKLALDAGLPVVIFNMQMSGAKLAHRLMCSVGRFDQHNLRTGRAKDDDWGKLAYAIGKLNDAPISFGNPNEVRAKDIAAHVCRLRETNGRLGLVIVDGLNLMGDLNSQTAYDRNMQLSNELVALKRLALEQGVPLIVTAQLSRACETRPNKRPVLSDLRDVGASEEIADLVLFIYRDEIYNPDSMNMGMSEIIIAKQNDGPVGTVTLMFIAEYMRFENYARAGQY